MNTTIRKSLLYKTKVEYGDYTVNHVIGCSHGCKYPCYAMMLSKRFGRHKTYEEWCEPVLVSNALELLDKEIPKYKEDIKSVQLCFMTDPFMYGYNDIADMSIKIINKFNENGIKCTALTKGIFPSELIQTSKINEYGITLISLDERYRETNEPGASAYHERIESLKKLHDVGYKTWVSIEPYPTPNIIDQDFDEILEAIKFVDKIIFGRLNYNKMVTAYKDYKNYFNQLAYKTIEFCNINGIQYHIKSGTISKETLEK